MPNIGIAAFKVEAQHRSFNFGYDAGPRRHSYPSWYVHPNSYVPNLQSLAPEETKKIRVDDISLGIPFHRKKIGNTHKPVLVKYTILHIPDNITAFDREIS